MAVAMETPAYQTRTIRFPCCGTEYRIPLLMEDDIVRIIIPLTEQVTEQVTGQVKKLRKTTGYGIYI